MNNQLRLKNIHKHFQLLDMRVLGNYGYRDDGMLLYKAIMKYVNKIVFNHYG